jgi:cyclic pyranopterin phosphate synthase
LLTFEEITRVARVFASLGVAKLRITGGEPLLRKDLPRLIGMLTAVEGISDIALTTNGLLLAEHAQALKQAGLRRVTVSMDSMDDAKLSAMSGRPVSASTVLEGIAAAASAGLAPIKINVVVQRGVNEDDALRLAACFRGTGHTVRFIEYMDVGNCNGWTRDQVVPSRELRDRIHARFPLEPIGREFHGEVATRYRYRDGMGEIGFISSVTEPFCGGCVRARLSADGQMYTCLFAAKGVDLRALMRDGAGDDELAGLVRSVWERRADRYSELRAALEENARPAKKIEMYHIGG